MTEAAEPGSVEWRYRAGSSGRSSTAEGREGPRVGGCRATTRNIGALDMGLGLPHQELRRD